MARRRPQVDYNALEFVNVTEPLNPKNAAHRKTVRTHVMGRYWHGRESGVKPSVHRPLLSSSMESEGCRYGCRGIGYGELEQDGVTRMTMPCPRCGILGDCGNTKARRFINLQVNGDPGDERIVSQIRRQNEFSPREDEIGSPDILLGGGDRDPFSSFAVQTTRHTEILLRHWLINLSPVLCPLETSEKKTPDPVTEILTPLVMSDAAMFHALIAFSSSLVDVRSGQGVPSTTTLVHRGSAIQLLKESMNDRRLAMSNEVLATICLVSCGHIIFRDHLSHQRHVEGINQIVALRGGIESLNTVPVIYWLVIWSDNFRSLHTDTAPRYKLSPCPHPHPQKLPPSPSPSPLPSTPELSSATSPWSLTSPFSALTPSFLSLTQQIQDLEHFIESHRGGSPSATTVAYFHHQRAFIEYRLATNIYSTSSEEDSGVAYQHCLFLAASLYYHVNLRPFCIWSSMRFMLLCKLKHALVMTELEGGWGGETELLLWVLVTAASVEDEGENWSVEQLRDVVRMWEPRLGLWEVKHMLKRVLWNERTSGGAVKKVFKEAGLGE